MKPLPEALHGLLGIPEARDDLAPEFRGDLDLDDVVVEKWLIRAEERSLIPLNLYRPRDITSPVPALVCTCGHGDSKGVPHLSMIARGYARAGVAGALADPLGEEERNAKGLQKTRAHDHKDVAYRSEMAGRSVMGKFVFDAMRVLDFLQTRDWVDRERLGLAGNSLGGAVGLWTFALEPRLRATIISGWAISDRLTIYGKHCTRAPNLKLRAVCDWPEFLGLASGALLVMNGDADVVIDHVGDDRVWDDTRRHLATVDPEGKRLHTWFCSGGGHRPYHGHKRAISFVQKELGTPLLSANDLAATQELHYGAWCDRHDIPLEKLYGVELHYRGAMLPDGGFSPIPREQLAVLRPDEIGTPDFTIDGWLAANES